MSHSGPDSVHALAADIRGGSLGKELTQKTLDKYWEAVAFYFDQARESGVLPDDGDPALTMIRTIEDAPRTIYMLRALYAAILEKKSGGQTDIPVLEAGCGSGFLAVLARLLHQDTRVTAVDIQKPCVRTTHAFAKTLDVSIKVREGDIKTMDLDGSRAIVIAEHLSPGAQEEHTDLVRHIKGVHPRYVIPLGIQPVVVMPNRGEILAVVGRPITLGNANTGRRFYVEHTSVLHGGFHPLATAINIRWSGVNPDLDSNWAEALSTLNREEQYLHHLLFPRDLAVNRALDPSLKWGIRVTGPLDRGVPVRFTVSYELGALSPNNIRGSSTVTASAPEDRAKAEVFGDDF